MEPAVRVEGVAKSFGETRALAGVDLEVAEGTVLGLLGPNGAGKTTLVRVLSTLLVPDGGRATVLGHDVVAEAGAVRELIGLTGQFAAVDDVLTGRENLRMFARLFHLGPAAARARADELLERFGLTDAADRPARTYSGGMRRRLDLASSLLTRPRVLFLDEPTTGVDPRASLAIRESVRELADEGTTVVLTTQYLEEADALADRIVVIDHGRVVAEGTGDELKDRAGGATVQVRLARREDRERALAVLGAGAHVDGREDTLVLPAQEEGIALVGRAAEALRGEGVAVTDLALRRPTLDEVFLQITGRTPSETEGTVPSVPGETVGTVPSVPRRARTALSWRAFVWGLSDCGVVARRNLRHVVRQPQLLLFSTVQPVMFVLLFAFVFGGTVEGALPGGVEYVAYLLPGILVHSTAFRATLTASGLAEDLERGVVDRFRSMPMARAAVLVGRTLADLVRNVLILALMITVGVLIGFRFGQGVLGAVGMVAVVALFGFALSWVFALLALTIKGQEAVQSASFIGVFPLVFASSVFVPVATMPAWLEAFAAHTPITYTADAARALALGEPFDVPVLATAAWLLGLLAVFVPLAVWRYRRMS
jgi:ABC transporter DrrB family efflux protein